MKLTAILLLTACLQVAARSNGQTVTLSVKDAPAKQVFRQIQKQTGLNILVKESLLGQIGKLTLDVKNASVDEVMNLCLKNQPLDYVIEGGSIVIRQKQVSDIQTENPLPPPIDVSGVVKNENGEPIAGASITIKGTKTGTTTDANGFFQLKNLNNDDVLVISGTNIETIEVKVGGKTVLSVTAKIKVNAIDEVQVRGYGTTTKRMNTGAITTIKGDEIKDRPVTDIMKALEGKVAGMNIINEGSGVGSIVTILIRGTNSITSGSDPLIIVDGVVMNEKAGALINPTTGGVRTGYAVSSFNYINPNDIESVDVLKDADATGIYGSRGTNGVILITTKKASLGKTKTSANVSRGWKAPTYTPRRMNTQQYLQMRKDAFAIGNMTASAVINPITPTAQNAPDLLLWDQNAYTDFQKMEIENPAPDYNANVNISGGTKQLNFVAAAGYYRMYDVYMNRPYQERMTSRFRLNHTSLDNKLDLELGAIMGVENQKLSFLNSITYLPLAVVNPPNFPLYKSDGSLNLSISPLFPGSTGYNPLPNSVVSTTSKTYNTLLDGTLAYKIVKGLVAKLQASFNSQSNEAHQIFPSTIINSQESLLIPAPYAYHTTYKFTSVNLEPQLSYTRAISRANITFLAGATYLDKIRASTSVKVNNPASDALLNSYGAGQPTTSTSDKTEEKFESVFGRLNADWDKKYILNVDFRRDGSSRFGPNNRFANFAAAGIGWIFTDERFLKNQSFLSYGKLRGSYGTTGNNNIPDYQYLGLLSAGNFTSGYSYPGPLSPSNYPNPNIRWETTNKNDIGLELGFFKNRILFTTSWYRSITNNLLVNLPLGSQSGFSSYYGNFPGQVQNTGQEFELVTQNLAPGSKVKWTTRINATHNANILKSFPNLASFTAYNKILKVGRALRDASGFYNMMEMPLHVTGIDPATGLPQFLDANKDGVINISDVSINAAWWGSKNPTIWGGVTNTVSYKGFTLDVFLQFTNGIFTKWDYLINAPIGRMYNPPADVAGNYWTKPGDVKKYPRPYIAGSGGIAGYVNPVSQLYWYSDAALYRGYYVRLKNLQLSYTLPATLLSKIKMSSAELYVSGENLAFYCPVKLFKDPEYTSSNSNGPGLLRTITTGLRIQF